MKAYARVDEILNVVNIYGPSINVVYVVSAYELRSSYRLHKILFGQHSPARFNLSHVHRQTEGNSGSCQNWSCRVKDDRGSNEI